MKTLTQFLMATFVTVLLVPTNVATAKSPSPETSTEQEPPPPSREESDSPQGDRPAPPPPRRRPPPEALAACQGKAAGAACSFTSPNGDSHTGTCFSPNADKPLACRPPKPPPRDR